MEGPNLIPGVAACVTSIMLCFVATRQHRLDEFGPNKVGDSEATSRWKSVELFVLRERSKNGHVSHVVFAREDLSTWRDLDEQVPPMEDFDSVQELDGGVTKLFFLFGGLERHVILLSPNF